MDPDGFSLTAMICHGFTLMHLERAEILRVRSPARIHKEAAFQLTWDRLDPQQPSQDTQGG